MIISWFCVLLALRLVVIIVLLKVGHRVSRCVELEVLGYCYFKFVLLYFFCLYPLSLPSSLKDPINRKKRLVITATSLRSHVASNYIYIFLEIKERSLQTRISGNIAPSSIEFMSWTVAAFCSFLSSCHGSPHPTKISWVLECQPIVLHIFNMHFWNGSSMLDTCIGTGTYD